jgi:hypothetical protein
MRKAVREHPPKSRNEKSTLTKIMAFIMKRKEKY